MSSHSFFRLPRALLAGLAAIALIGVASLFDGFGASAQAQVAISAEFRTALSPHGRWRNHPRWGEVWIANRTPRDWRPYTRGRWVFTDEWGWYWVSGDEEADWGWVTYHHGRWVFDRDFGWAWIPGNEWGPAWVDWRRGTEHVGWAPLPPEEIIVEYRDDPIYWTFVRPRYLLAPRIFLVIAPPRERLVIIRRTVVVNRTVIVERDGGRRRFAVNPGIEPDIVAAAVGRPIRASKVRPLVLAGTQVDGAVEVKGGERGRARVAVTESDTVIRPAAKVEPPKALAPGEPGRLGDRPPKAAQNATPVQPGAPQRGQPGDKPAGAGDKPSGAGEKPAGAGEKPAGAGEGAKPGAAERDKPAGAGEGAKPGAAERGKPAGAGEGAKPGAADRGKPAGAGEGAKPGAADRGKPAGAGEGGSQRNQRNERGGASPPPQAAPAQERRAAPPPPPPPQRVAPQRQPAAERSAPPPRPPAAERPAPTGKPAAQKSKQQQEDERRRGR